MEEQNRPEWEELIEQIDLTPSQRDKLREKNPDITDEEIEASVQRIRDEVRETHLENLERAKDQYERLGIEHDCTSAFDVVFNRMAEVPLDMLHLLNDTTDALEKCVRERDKALAQADELIQENLRLQELVQELRAA